MNRRLPVPSILVIALIAVSVAAQEKTARPDGWRGLVLDVSTAEDAIRMLGQPSKDKDKQRVELVAASGWLVWWNCKVENILQSGRSDHHLQA